jgi:hypothetical protein
MLLGLTAGTPVREAVGVLAHDLGVTLPRLLPEKSVIPESLLMVSEYVPNALVAVVSRVKDQFAPEPTSLTPRKATGVPLRLKDTSFRSNPTIAFENTIGTLLSGPVTLLGIAPPMATVGWSFGSITQD